MVLWLQTLAQDLRFASRSLRRNPGFTIAAAGTLALGIGATTVIFSAISGVLLTPLAFPDPARLVQLNEVSPRNEQLLVVHRDLEEFRGQSTSFEAAVSYGVRSRNLENVEDPEQVPVVTGERDLLRMLGVNPIAGRVFAPDDPFTVIVVGEGFARRRLGGVQQAVGRRILFDGEDFTVIGVMPADFQFPLRAIKAEAWLPWEVPAQYRNGAATRNDAVLARMKRGVTKEQASTELNGIARRLELQYPDTNKGRRARLTPLSEIVAGKARDSLLLLMGAVSMVLLVACVNVANLLLARAARRSREVAIRAALGAQGSRLMRQFLTESLVLALAGGLLGLGLARAGWSLLVTLATAEIPRLADTGFDWRVFTFLLVVCVATGIAFGLAPAIGAARADLQGALKKSGGHATAAAARLRDALVVAQIAAAFVLLIGAGLLLRTMLRLQDTPVGFDPENVVTLHIAVPASRSQGPGAVGQYCQAIEERVRRIPGVRAAGFISYLPLENSNWTANISIPGHPHDPAKPMQAELRYVTPGYFDTLHIPIRKGRALRDSDAAGAPLVILVNEALARQYFPGEDPIGRQIAHRGEIVGVVGDVRQSSLSRPAVPEIYYSVAQNFSQVSSAGTSLLVRAQGDPSSIVRDVAGAVRAVNPSQSIFNIKTMDRVIADSLSNLSLHLWLLAVFAGLTLALAVAGIYGVISYAVTQRTQEFAVRLALGADKGRVLRIVLFHGARLIAMGLAIGVCAAAVLTRLLESLLFEVTPMDPPTVAVMAALLSAVALAACAVPAQRAMSLDPALTLKYE